MYVSWSRKELPIRLLSYNPCKYYNLQLIIIIASVASVVLHPTNWSTYTHVIESMNLDPEVLLKSQINWLQYHKT